MQRTLLFHKATSSSGIGIERANIFFNHILETADKPVDDRTVHFYLQAPDSDGGQWHMAISLIRKYGLVPTYAQDESFTANNTAAFNQALNMKLREDGLILRKLAQEGKSDEIEQNSQEFLSEVYRMAVIAFGQPVQKFDLEFKDDDGKYKLDQNLSPLDFFHNYFEDDWMIMLSSLMRQIMNMTNFMHFHLRIMLKAEVQLDF